jgi:transcriptional regulator with XRE-family HTH domain
MYFGIPSLPMSKAAKPRYLNGAALLEARKAAGLEQTELGERVGATQGQISGWERGHTGCRLGMVHALASALGIDPRNLMLPGTDDAGSGTAEPNRAVA